MTEEQPIVRSPPEEQSVAADPRDALETENIEPSLLPPSRRLLRRFPIEGLDWKYVQHLEHRIQRNPRDLLAHVRRVLLHHALADPAGVVGALVDLFLILGAHGLGLRRRLLRRVSDLLSEDDYQLFFENLETGLDASEASSSAYRSCLSRQITGTTSIVTRQRDDGQATTDLIMLSRESVAAGQRESAQVLLEGALEADPGREDVCIELLTLYRRERLRGDFYKTYTAVLGRGLARPDLWQETAAFFESGDYGNEG